MYKKEEKKKEFVYGFKQGIPIAIGYIPVSFSFGLMAVSAGLPVWLVVFLSLSNVTSAGQFAGTNLILAGGGYLEIALTTFVINIRYMLMSLSLSQKVSDSFTLPQRFLAAFGITDEIFSVASMEKKALTFPFMAGLIIGPVAGWTLGTLLGGLICAARPEAVASAMGIALYGMFIAIIIPPARKSRAVVMIIAISVAISCILRYVPMFSAISSGFRVIIATLIGAGVGAFLFPIKEEEET
ncbi:MAG: AzlC family ABC transporter permease [Lachnospiraceae bacterium]|nr:AzlC family ABC transporter permease [Lachnospiraceae bacterium]